MSDEKRIKEAIPQRPILVLESTDIAIHECTLGSAYESGNYTYDWTVYLANFKEHELIRLSSKGLLKLGSVIFDVELIGFQALNSRLISVSLKPLQFPERDVLYIYDESEA